MTGTLAHSAVVVFFVISGYVIASAARRDGSAAGYAVSRAARIYSVALPALALTFILDVATGNTSYQHAQPWKYLPLFLGFATDWWFLTENAFSNVPYWSLSYEVWYYVIFGIALFAHGWWRWLLIGLVLALIGPRQWLLLPVWLLGVALHRAPRVPRPRWILAAALLGGVVLHASGLDAALNGRVNDILGGFPGTHLRYSQYFVGDYLFAALVAVAIVAARDAELGFLARWRGPIAAAASVSFSMYLMHYPLFVAFASVFPGNNWVIGLGTLACVVAFGILFERNKAVARRLLLAVTSLRVART